MHFPMFSAIYSVDILVCVEENLIESTHSTNMFTECIVVSLVQLVQHRTGTNIDVF